MTTLQRIMQTIRLENIVAQDHVYYGLSDKLKPPYVSVRDYKHKIDYDTGGAGLKTATFAVMVVDQSQDGAEDIATQVDDLINLNLSLTPQTIGVLQENYEVGQLDPNNLYQFGVLIEYQLIEDLNK